MFAIQDTIEEFKQWRPYLTNATADFVNDFYKSAQGLTSMEDYTSHNNKYYSDHNAPETYPLYVNNREFNVHLDRREKQSKYADYPIMINVPVGVTHDEVFDRRGNLVSARGLIDFANKTALLDFQAHNNGYTASTMHVIDKPKKGKSDFLGTIPSRIGYPMTLKDVDYRTDGIVTASEMVVYKTDEDNKLVSTRTYLNPVIKPLVAKKGNGVRPGDFVINSRMTLDADYYKGNVKSTRFYMGHKEYHEGNFVDEAAERMLEVKRHGMAKAYLDFAEDIDGSSCRVVQDCNL